MLDSLEEALEKGDHAGCWCHLTHPTKLTTDENPWSGVYKLVNVHEDGYLTFVSADSFYKPLSPSGIVDMFTLRRDEIAGNLSWVKSGYIETLDNGRVHWTGDELEKMWYLNKVACQ